jgi:hypothetical protein
MGHTPECLEMLAALKGAVKMIIWMSGSPSFGPGGEAFEGWKQARERLDGYLAAIAKAEGSPVSARGEANE